VGRVAAALRALTGRGPRSSALLRAPEEPEEEAAEPTAEQVAEPEAEEVAEPIVEPVAEEVAEPVASPLTGEQAAARIDAARERLRSTIAPPDDEDPARPPA